MIDSNDPDEIDRIIREGIPDPVGSFYRFSLAGSLLRRKKLPTARCKTSGNGDAGNGEHEQRGISRGPLNESTCST